MNKNEWIDPYLSSIFPPTPALQAYLSSRNCTPSETEFLLLKEFSLIEEAPLPRGIKNLTYKYQNGLVVPLYTPLKAFAGLQIQDIHSKRFRRELTLKGHWNPIWLNIQNHMGKIWDGADIWLVEGIFDLIALQRILGYDIVVLGCLTANLSVSQKNFLKRYAKNIKVVFDMDEAGDSGAERVRIFAKINNIGYQRITYPAKDPADLLQERGLEASKSLFQKYYYRL